MSLLNFLYLPAHPAPSPAARQRGSWLRTKRENRCLTLGDMADAAGLGLADYCNIERGRVEDPDPLAWLRICTLLECRIDDWTTHVVDLVKRLVISLPSVKPGACLHVEVVARDENPDDGRCAMCGETGFPMSWDEYDGRDDR